MGEKFGIGSMYLCSVYGWAQIVCKVLHESDNANLINGKYGQKTILALYFMNFLLLSVSLVFIVIITMMAVHFLSANCLSPCCTDWLEIGMNRIFGAVEKTTQLEKTS